MTAETAGSAASSLTAWPPRCWLGDLASIYLGDRLGLYAELPRGRAVRRPPSWRRRPGDRERYAREWLEQQAVDRHPRRRRRPEADAAERRYRLPAAHAEVLLDRDSLRLRWRPQARVAVGSWRRAARGARGVSGAAAACPTQRYGADLREGLRPITTAPRSSTGSVADWLPAIPDVDARLRSRPRGAGGRRRLRRRLVEHRDRARLPAGAGGRATTSTTPRSRSPGATPRDAGLARPRHASSVGDAADPGWPAGYDLVTHSSRRCTTWPDPVAVLAALRALLAPDGSRARGRRARRERFRPPATTSSA